MIPWIVAITLYICAENLGFAALQVWLLERRRPWPKGLAWLIFGWAALMSGLAILQACEPESWKAFMYEWLYFPMAVEMVWNILFLQVLLPAMILVALCVRRFSPIPLSQPLTPAGLSRRKFLYLVGYGAVPAVAIGMGVHGALTREDLRLREFKIPLEGLPPELEGFTIAHVSDLHSGLFVGPERLKRMSDMTNDLKADLVVVTGDLINREMTEFPPALAAIQRLESRYGLYLCEGNHDVMPGEGLIVAACAQNGLKMLFNSCVTLPVRGRRLVIAGLPWARPGYPGQDREIAGLFPAREQGDVRILLAHHPHTFDVADSADLLLSGHTHGGQIMLNDHIGLGPLRFKYCSGLFQRGNTTMIVNNGCGDWFPCRIGAPAEIGLLRLTKAAT
jgi:hypothetical protein